MHLVVDTISRNVMGEYESLADAEALRDELVAHNPAAAAEILVVSGTEAGAPNERDEIREALLECLDALTGWHGPDAEAMRTSAIERAHAALAAHQISNERRGEQE